MMIAFDLHAHTFFSECGIHTHCEMLTRAKQCGLDGLAITDHGPAMHGHHPSPVTERLHAPVEGVQYLKGIEANVTDEAGSIDVSEALRPRLDIVLLGLHLHFQRKDASTDWTGPLVRAIHRNPCVDIISHPVDPNFPINLEQVAQVARETGTALELNNSKVKYGRVDVAPIQRFLAICRDAGCFVAVNSDAHALNEVGDVSCVWPLLEASGISDDRIVNLTASSTEAFLKRPSLRI